MLPDLDAMMPTQSWGGSDFISIVARTDQQGSQVMLARLREQLSRSGDLRDAGVGWSLDGELIDLGALEKGQPLENSVTTVATYVKERLKTRIRKGERLNELQENTLGGR